MTADEGVLESADDPVRGRIAVVGVCASGKTMLVGELRARGYDARHCVQEHSYVADMWQRVSRPEVLVYLDASLPVIARRRRIDYGQDYWQEQCRRLAHARGHCHIYVSTDTLTETGVLHIVLAGLGRLRIDPGAPGDRG